jgi:hypothetical protein
MEQQGNLKDGAKPLVSRRTVAIGAAWTAPVVLFAVASPSASASPLPQPVVTLGEGNAKKGPVTKTVDFSLTFSSDVATTVSIISVTPNEAWTKMTSPDALPLVLSIGAGTAACAFTLKRSNNATGDYVVSYSVAGGPVRTAPVRIAT